MEKGKKTEEKSVYVEMEREIPKIEEVDLKTYAEDIRRYQNSQIESGGDFFPELFEKDAISIVQMMNWLDPMLINTRTGKNTRANIVESYIMSGAYTEKFLDEVFKIEQKEIYAVDSNGDKITNFEEIYTRDESKYKRIELEAVRNWKMKGLNQVVLSYFDEKMGGLSHEEMIKNIILSEAYTNECPKIKLSYVKVAAKILGMDNNKQAPSIVVWEKGGKERTKIVAQSGNMGFLLSNGGDEDDSTE